MRSMFSRCENLFNIDLSNFDTENVENLSQMFFGCTNLIDINLSNFDTKKVINMNGLFCH